MADLISHTPGLCGGRACIDGHRLPVWLFESYRRAGDSEAGLIESYPQITTEQLRAAFAYADANKAEIEQDIADQNEPFDDIPFSTDHLPLLSRLLIIAHVAWNRFKAFFAS